MFSRSYVANSGHSVPLSLLDSNCRNSCNAFFPQNELYWISKWLIGTWLLKQLFLLIHSLYADGWRVLDNRLQSWEKINDQVSSQRKHSRMDYYLLDFWTQSISCNSKRERSGEQWEQTKPNRQLELLSTSCHRNHQSHRSHQDPGGHPSHSKRRFQQARFH